MIILIYVNALITTVAKAKNTFNFGWRAAAPKDKLANIFGWGGRAGKTLRS